MRRLIDWIAAIALAGALIWVVARLPQETVSGDVRVIDGDSLAVDGQEIRLFGIDAPELRQNCRRDDGAVWPCGRAARERLAQLAGAGEITCTGGARDRYERLVAECTVGESDLAGELVRSGLALAYRKAATAYARQEEEARAARRGVWAGSFEPPWEWRERHGATRER